MRVAFRYYDPRVTDEHSWVNRWEPDLSVALNTIVCKGKDYTQSPAGIRSTAWRKTGSTFVYCPAEKLYLGQNVRARGAEFVVCCVVRILPNGQDCFLYDPKTALERVMCPALFLFGELDTQVPAEANRLAILEVLKRSGNNDYTTKTIVKANHMFQSAKTGSPREYMSLEKQFVPGFLELMSDWVLKRVDVVSQ